MIGDYFCNKAFHVSHLFCNCVARFNRCLNWSRFNIVSKRRRRSSWLSRRRREPACSTKKWIKRRAQIRRKFLKKRCGLDDCFFILVFISPFFGFSFFNLQSTIGNAAWTYMRVIPRPWILSYRDSWNKVNSFYLTSFSETLIFKILVKIYWKIKNKSETMF